MQRFQCICRMRRLRIASTGASLYNFGFRNASTASVSSRQSIVNNSSRAYSNLSCLPLSHILRSYVIAAASRSPTLLGVWLSLFRSMMSPDSLVFNVDRNPLLHLIVKKTLYAQFCAGQSEEEVQKTTSGFKKTGYHGVILEYAREAPTSGTATKSHSGSASTPTVEEWRNGMLQTVRMTSRGDFVGLKWVAVEELCTECTRLP